jgi:hypothetical protein
MTAPHRRPATRLRLPRVAVAGFLLALTVRPSVAPATVAEQRARLPPAAECEHPVEGTWKAIIFRQNYNTWHEFILEVRAVPGSATDLTGIIKVDTWAGGPEQSEPGPCRLERFKGTMDGRGSFQEGQVNFGGGPFRLEEMVCGDPRNLNYAPDQFSGRLEPERQEFQAVNNDGNTAVNEPAVFRRISCFDDAPITQADAVKPPPFFPERSGGGC